MRDVLGSRCGGERADSRASVGGAHRFSTRRYRGEHEFSDHRRKKEAFETFFEDSVRTIMAAQRRRDSRGSRDDVDQSDEEGEICGEENPGFWLWTSAHGFHHFKLSQTRCWRVFWLLLVLLCAALLVGAVIWYFYNVFSEAVYTRITMENPSSMEWPTTIVCEKQVFKRSKLGPAGLSTNLASLLTWSFDSKVALPEVYNTDTRITGLQNGLDSVLARADYNGSHDKLIEAASPTCVDFILECKLRNRVLNSTECCGDFFNPMPVISQYGTCYTTNGGKEKFTVKGAGENNGLQVVTVHEDATLFENTLTHEDILGTNGVSFAVVDEHTSVVTALRTRGQSAQIGSVVSVGLTRTRVDNSDLEFSAIGRMSCIQPGSKSSDDVDSDFLVGLDFGGDGYTRDNCQTAKDEILARDLLNCTFNTASGDNYERCSPLKSATYYRSFHDSDNSALDKVEVVEHTSSTRSKYDKDCTQDCISDRYSVTVSTSELSNELKQELSQKVQVSGQNINVVVLKFFLNSLEYQRIHNFPLHGLQFIAEIGGLMAFFLGISVISLCEFLLFCCNCCHRRCCPCCHDAQEDVENLPPPKWKRTEPNYRRRSTGAAPQSRGDNTGSGRQRPDLSRFDEK